jgi:hypothetical protein
MQKLLALLNRAGKTEEQDAHWDTLEMPIIVNTQQINHNHEDTRPTYRIGKHTPTEVDRAIDLAG